MRTKDNNIIYALSFVVFAVAAMFIAQSPTDQAPVHVPSQQPQFSFIAVSGNDTSFACELFIDGMPSGRNGSVLNDTPTILVPNVSLSEGNHAWSISCQDSESVNVTETSNIIVDVTPPQVGLTLYSEPGSLSVNASASDANLYNLTVNVLSEGNIINSASSGSGSIAFVLGPLPEGTYNVTASAYDLAGNLGTNESEIFIHAAEQNATQNASQPETPPAKNKSGTRHQQYGIMVITSPALSFVLPTPGNGSAINSTIATFNVSVSMNASSCSLEFVGSVGLWDNVKHIPVSGGEYNYNASEGVGGFSSFNMKNELTLAVGLNHTCYILNSGNSTCYGSNDYGESTNYAGGDAVSVAAGARSTCYLLSSGNSTCYGDTACTGIGSCQGASGEATNYAGGNAIAVSEGVFGTVCYVLRNGNSTCYGTNAYGSAVNYAGGNAISVYAGGTKTCYLLDNGNVTCYGAGGGWSSYDGSDAIAVSVGIDNTCVLLANGSSQCAGYGFGSSPATPYSGLDVVGLTAGGDGNCRLLDSGNSTCYGDYWYSGDAGPVENYGGGNAVLASEGYLHSCYVLSNGNSHCDCGMDTGVACTNYSGGDIKIPFALVWRSHSMTVHNNDANTWAILTVTNLSEGLHEYYANCSDLAGDANTTETRSVMVDTVNPGIQFDAPTDNSSAALHRNYVQINVSATDSGSGLSNITIYIYNSTGELVNSSNSTASPLFINWTGLPNATYYFNATAYDSAGNFNKTETRNFNFTAPAPSQPLQCPLNGMVSYWRFDDGSNTTATDSAGSNNATVYGAIPVPGQVGDALGFDGENDYLTTGAVPSGLPVGSSPRSMAAWFKLSDVNLSDAEIISYGPNVPAERYAFYITSSVIGVECAQAPTPVVSWTPDANWHFLASTYTGGSCSNTTVYFDGVPINSASDSGSALDTGATAVEIGRLSGLDGYYFNGSIDEAAIYNRSLSASEILQQYDNGLGSMGYCSAAAPPSSPTVSIQSPLQGQTYNAPVSLNYTTTGTNCWFVLNDVADYSSISSCQNLSLIPNLVQGLNNMTVYANNSLGAQNNTAMISFTYNYTSAPPTVGFVTPPTPENGSVINYPNPTINVSSDKNLSGCTLYVSGKIETHPEMSVSSASQDYRVCYVLTSGNSTCYGSNLYDMATNYTGSNAIAVSSGYGMTCYLLGNGNSTCYGDDRRDQTMNYTGGDAIRIASASDFTCYLLSDGTTRCLGDNYPGEDLTDYMGGDAVDVAAGDDHACYLLENGTGICHGFASYNYTGGDAVAVFAGDDATCYLLSNGSTSCQNYNIEYAGGDAVSLSLAGGRACYLLSNGNSVCYGNSATGNKAASYTGGDAVAIATGQSSTCYVLNNGNSVCYSDDNQKIANYAGGDIRLLWANYSMQINNADAGTTANYTVQLNNGIHSYYANCTSATNQTNITETKDVIIDLIKPTVSFTNPSTGTSLLAAQRYIEANVTASDANLANVTLCLYNVTGGANCTILAAVNNAGNYVNWTGLADGTYYWNATATDMAGNTNSTETRNTTIMSFSEGNGTIANPYLITDCYRLQLIGTLNLSASYALNSSIDCSDTVNWNSHSGFVPLGTSSAPFTGTFDGNNHTISGLYLNRLQDYAGLFGYATGAAIRNVRMVDEYINNGGNWYGHGSNGGGLIGYSNYDTIHNSYANVSITGNYQVGGLIGYSYSDSISGCYASGNVTEYFNQYYNFPPNSGFIGGLVGYAGSSNISDSYSTADVFVLAAGTFHISQFDGASWNEVYERTFPVQYATEAFGFNQTGGKVKLRITQKDLDFADIDSIRLQACGENITPDYAIYADTGQSVLDDVLHIDNNVIAAHEKPVEMSWSIPSSCSEEATVYLTANEYGEMGAPFLFNGAYRMGSAPGAITVDGVVNESDGVKAPQYTPYWTPVTGHPPGYTYVYISDDSQNVYFSIDVTADNTNDSQDWTALTINGKEFMINDTDAAWGRCAFGMTGRVSYKHETCEFSIPKSEIAAPAFTFALRYYGTSASPPSYFGGLVGYSQSSLINNTYATGSVIEGGYYDVGGLVGYSGSSTISNSFSAGPASGAANAGGLIGLDEGNNAFSNSYWDAYLGTQGICTGNNGDVAGCTGEDSDGSNISYFYNASNAPLSSWDFINVWQANATGYPILRTFTTAAATPLGITFMTPTTNTTPYTALNYISANVTANSTDLKNVTTYLYNSTGLYNSTNTTAAGLFINWTALPDGLYHWDATAYDNAGRSNSTETRSVTIDTANPAISFTAATDSSGITLNKSYIQVNVTASDSGSGLKNITVYLYNSTGMYNRTNGTTSPLSINWTGLPDAVYYFNATAYDNANNLNKTETRNVTIDTQAPTITATSPGGSIDSNSFTLSFTVNDTNLDSCRYSLDNGTGVALPNCTGTRVSSVFGSHCVTIYANDTAGNTNSSSACFRLYNSHVPSPTVVEVQPPPPAQNQTLQLHLSIGVACMQDGTGDVTVTATGSNNPVSSVALAIPGIGETFYTDSAGRATVPGLLDGAFTVSGTKAGYGRAQTSFSVSCQNITAPPQPNATVNQTVGNATANQTGGVIEPPPQANLSQANVSLKPSNVTQNATAPPGQNQTAQPGQNATVETGGLMGALKLDAIISQAMAMLSSASRSPAIIVSASAVIVAAGVGWYVFRIRKPLPKPRQ